MMMIIIRIIISIIISIIIIIIILVIIINSPSVPFPQQDSARKYAVF